MLIAMKKATLFALKEDRDAILLALQKDGNIMLISEGDKTQTLEGADKVGDQIAKAKELLGIANQQNGGKGRQARQAAAGQIRA